MNNENLRWETLSKFSITLIDIFNIEDNFPLQIYQADLQLIGLFRLSNYVNI